MHKVKVIASTTIPSQKDISVAHWLLKLVQQDRGMEAEFLDLAQVDFPSLDEPNHSLPVVCQHQQTKRWSATIGEADAFIIVLSEYNVDLPTHIKNAMDCLSKEWKYKPVAFVSYGEMSGGGHSTQMLKQAVSALGMKPVIEAVSIPFFTQYLNDEDSFLPESTVTRAACVMLSELKRWSKALKEIRSQVLN